MWCRDTTLYEDNGAACTDLYVRSVRSRECLETGLCHGEENGQNYLELWLQTSEDIDMDHLLAHMSWRVRVARDILWIGDDNTRGAC